MLGPEDSSHPPVVFVHGILVDSRLWDRVADGLARQGFRCYPAELAARLAHASRSNDGAELSPVGVATMIHDFIVALGLRM